MKTWEYIKLEISPLCGREKELSQMNNLGSDGWELISTVKIGFIVVHYFKRIAPNSGIESTEGQSK